MPAPDLAELIRERAYQRWETRGNTPGNAEEDWYEAEREIKAMDTSVERAAEDQSSPSASSSRPNPSSSVTDPPSDGASTPA